MNFSPANPETLETGCNGGYYFYRFIGGYYFYGGIFYYRFIVLRGFGLGPVGCLSSSATCCHTHSFLVPAGVSFRMGGAYNNTDSGEDQMGYGGKTVAEISEAYSPAHTSLNLESSATEQIWPTALYIWKLPFILLRVCVWKRVCVSSGLPYVFSVYIGSDYGWSVCFEWFSILNKKLSVCVCVAAMPNRQLDRGKAR